MSPAHFVFISLRGLTQLPAEAALPLPVQCLSHLHEREQEHSEALAFCGSQQRALAGHAPGFYDELQRTLQAIPVNPTL